MVLLLFVHGYRVVDEDTLHGSPQSTCKAYRFFGLDHAVLLRFIFSGTRTTGTTILKVYTTLYTTSQRLGF